MLDGAIGRTWLGAMQNAWANRKAFWAQATVMIVNDLFWVVFWTIFFTQLGEVRGWTLDDVMILLAVLTTAGGIVLGLFNNTRMLGRLISEGGLDEALVLPVPTLPYLLARRIEPINIGDIVFGIGIFFVAANPTPGRTLAYLIATMIASVALGSFLVLANCTAFIGGRSDTGELGFHAMLLFSAYPVDVFSGVMRIVLFTVIPAGFVTSMPTRFVRDVDWSLALAAGAFAVGLAVLAHLAFRTGLRRYTSGALWTAA